MKMQEIQLPQGWEIKKLGEVCETGSGGTPLKMHKDYYEGGTIPWLLSGEVSQGEILEAKNFITEKGLKNSSAKLFPQNTVLVAMYGATAGQVGILRFEATTNQAVCGILPNDKTVPEYLFYCFLSKKEELIAQAVGGAQPNISQIKIKNTNIPLPPIPEQQRIVSILDEAFAAIAKVKANAEQNLKNAKELFESYLQGVFENGDWEKKELRELTTILGDGLHGTPEYSINGEYYFINGNNLNDGKIEFKDNTKRVNVGEFNKYKKNLTDRTILVSINGTLGNVAFYNNEKIILGKSACYFNLKENIDKSFVKYVLSSPYFIKYAHKEATGATIKNVSLKSMREFKVPFPNFKEQQTIVNQLDALHAETQKLEAVYRKKIADLEELKKSLLQKAFSGEL